MRNLAVAIVSFALTLTLFAALSTANSQPKPDGMIPLTSLSGTVLVRIPATASSAESFAVIPVDNEESYERGWISATVVPASPNAGIFGRLRADLK